MRLSGSWVQPALFLHDALHCRLVCCRLALLCWPAAAPLHPLSHCLSHPPAHCAVVDDLLSAFLGLSGGYVRVKPLAAPGGQRLGYEVAAQGQLEPALAEMAARMLPIW